MSAPTGHELQTTLRRWASWIQGDKVTVEDDQAVEALAFLADVYLPEHGVASMDEPVWPSYMGGSGEAPRD